MRSALTWILGIAAGIAVVLVVTALIGNRDKSGDTVPAGEYAQTVCGAVGTWRGEMEAIVEEIRTPPSSGSLGVEEPQSQTPQGRTELVRSGLETGVQATKTLVEGIDNAGIPDTPQGSAAADQVSAWADTSKQALENAQDSLHNEATTLEEAFTQFAGAALAVRTTLASGVQAIVSISHDPQLAAAFSDSSTCQELRGEQSST